jgi:CRP/FNR family transcriptional regulator
MNDLVSAITPHATKRVVKKRTILLYQGEIPRAAHVIKAGVIKMYSVNNAGEEQIVQFQTAGDIFPAPWIFDKVNASLYYFEAVSDCEILTLPKQEFKDVVEKNETVRAELFDYFVSNYTGLLMRITALEQARAIEKILFTLYYLLSRYGKQTKPGVYSVKLNLTHSIIASLVGLTRETTATELNKLRRRGILIYNTHEYSINKEKLERFLGEDSFKDLHLS